MSKIVQMPKPNRKTIGEPLEQSQFEIVGHIPITETDRHIMQGMDALGRYGGEVNKAKNALRRVEKDINRDGNLKTLREAMKHIENAIDALETWKQLASP